MTDTSNGSSRSSTGERLATISDKADKSALKLSRGPLAGVRVVALEQLVAGPFATMWLADAGAEVIKVEEPGKGDGARTVAPVALDSDGTSQSLSFLRMNRNKKSVSLDVRTSEGRAILVDLIASADIFTTNLAPTTLKRYQLDFPSLAESVGPGLLYISISGFGHSDVLPGPYSDRPAFDNIAQAMGGLMYRSAGAATGPVYSGFPLVDISSGMVAANAALLGLRQREQTGIGGHIDISMYDIAATFNELALIITGATGQEPEPGLHGLSCPFGVYHARDGYVAIGVIGEELWRRCCGVLGREDLLKRSDLSSGILRNQHEEEIRKIVEGWLAEQSAADAVTRLVAAHIPAGLVQRAADLLDCEHLAAREMILTIDDSAWGPVRVAGNPIKMPQGIYSPPHERPPLLSEHTEEILRGLGMDEERLQELRRTGIVGTRHGSGNPLVDLRSASENHHVGLDTSEGSNKWQE